MANSDMLGAVGALGRRIGFGVVAGLVVAQATAALFDDLVNRQASFEAVGWGNWFLYLLVPILAGSLLLYYGRRPPDPARAPERAALAGFAGLAAASAVLRVLTPAFLHAGDIVAPRLPRSLADGFSLVAAYVKVAPLAGAGGRYDVVTAVVSSAVLCAAVAFGAMAFERGRTRTAVMAGAVTGAVWAGVGWYVPGGAGVRIIGSLWPVLVFGSLAAVLAVVDLRT